MIPFCQRFFGWLLMAPLILLGIGSLVIQPHGLAVLGAFIVFYLFLKGLSILSL